MVSTKRVNEHRHTPGAVFWQRNYYEYMIRNEDSLHCIRKYIIIYPVCWLLDRENMGAIGGDPADAEWFG